MVFPVTRENIFRTRVLEVCHQASVTSCISSVLPAAASPKWKVFVGRGEVSSTDDHLVPESFHQSIRTSDNYYSRGPIP